MFLIFRSFAEHFWNTLYISPIEKEGILKLLHEAVYLLIESKPFVEELGSFYGKIFYSECDYNEILLPNVLKNIET